MTARLRINSTWIGADARCARCSSLRSRPKLTIHPTSPHPPPPPPPGYYFTGDGARRDADGHFWITGRVDDVINVSGHRIGTAEVESALVGHPACAEAAVVGYDHPVKGQGIWAYVTLNEGKEPSEALRKGLVAAVRKEIGPFAAPDVIHWAPALPKTRSGKIMRRVLRKVAAGEEDSLGDVSTLADPGVVAQLLASRGK
jgi:acetyl-CoA synthetase